MNKDISLTVCIPTYNRPETLEKILQQFSTQTNSNFQLLISDDKSPDNGATERLVKSYMTRMPNLKYHKNEENLGYSGNVCKLYELANTRYIWFLCDDDTVLNDSIEKILNALYKYQPVVAVFNHKQLDPYGLEVLGGSEEDRVYENLSDLKDYQPLQRLTFLSTIVLEKRLPADAIKQQNYRDNIFFQITLGLLLLSSKFLYCEIGSVILIRNVGFKYGEFFKFYLVDHLKSVTIVNHIFDNSKFVKWSIRHLPIAFKLYMSQKLGMFLYKGWPTKETLKYITRFYGIYSLLIFLFPVAYILTPTPVIKLVYFAQLVHRHGYVSAKEIYRNSVGRVYKDSRKTGFTSYR